MEKKKILIADDEERITELVSDFLIAAGFDTLVAHDGAKALELVNSEHIDLAVIDIMMPEIDGWKLTSKIRENHSFPIIMLSARSEEFDQLESFANGADEYVAKPFSPAVLVKRIEALLKRAEANLDVKNLENKGLSIDRASFTASIDGKLLELTLKEFELLCLLYENCGRVFSRNQLLNDIWGYDYMGDERTVDSHIARLRTKLGPYGASHLKTVYGMGYKIEKQTAGSL